MKVELFVLVGCVDGTFVQVNDFLDDGQGKTGRGVFIFGRIDLSEGAKKDRKIICWEVVARVFEGDTDLTVARGG